MEFVRGMYHFLRTDPAAPPDLRERAEICSCLSAARRATSP